MRYVLITIEIIPPLNYYYCRRNYSALSDTTHAAALADCAAHGLGLVKWDSLEKWTDVVDIAGG